MIRLYYSTKAVFKAYSERLTIKSTSFSGVLRDVYADENDDVLIYFIAGGRTPLAYDLKRDGAKVRGKIYFNDLDLDNPDDTIKGLGKVDVYWNGKKKTKSKKSRGSCKKLSDRDMEKVRLLRDKGVRVADIAKYFGVHIDTVFRRLREDVI